ncbi:hypothetical protein GGX14DRAFT_345713 [Mycena pura]|uniref:RNA polymerase II assembly factor Rtp1 C-terminal domain-containing protein n=1 Tax=Mycena pura TaxID=153505 RepID=A0AAD6YSZ1_9AGAR|nr:hypothetical protein GGX14DRAFT_345713 [Mycena pura]
MTELRTLLAAGLCIIESAERASESHDLQSVLACRLKRYYAYLELHTIVDASDSLETLELKTAIEALNTLEGVHRILDTEDVPIGTRDLAEVRTLLGITFRWGINPVLSKAMLAWASRKPPQPIIDLTTAPEDYKLLCLMLSRLLNISLLGNSPTFVTTSLLNRHLDQLLRPCIVIGWLPKSLTPDATLETIRLMTIRLLEIMPPSQNITALGSVLSVKPCPPYVHKSCASLLSQQLLRPEGARGLCEAVFGEDAANEIQLEKIEHVVRVLTTAPAGMSMELYFSTITPRVLELLSDRAPPTYRRAAAFSVSRMLTMPACSTVLSFLHPPLLSTDSSSSPRVALSTITMLIANTDPSPTFISCLLSPILSALYSLSYHLDQVKTSDPNLKEMVQGLLGTWVRVIGITEGLAILWSVIDGEGGYWRVDLEGQITRLEKSEKIAPLSVLTPADEDIDVDANILDLYPDPVHFVRFIGSIQRTDISSELFVRLLESYRQSKLADGDPTRTLLYLQLVVQMQTRLSDGPSTILGQPAHMISFVKHALKSRDSNHGKKMQPSQHNPFHLGLGEPDEGDESDEGDSDDDTPGADIIDPDDEMVETSVNLLLAVFEANEDLSAKTSSELDEIFSLLEPLSLSGSPSIQPLAREARMVMTARLASTSSPKQNVREGDNSREIYQKALKLLQDPILPVRGHGLLLLRQLVSPQPTQGAKITDPALMPAILSIFLQSAQVDDSYIFLNAIQGLAAMVDTYGKDVLKGLVKEYGQGLDGLGADSMTPHDLDVRTRVGEALASVIKRCGSALPAYIDILVPPLFQIVRSSQVPITLRTSALSLLAECENTCPAALIPYITDLAEAMVDLLQIESTSTTPTESEDSDPTSKNSKQPPFRRAALHFLGLLIRETSKQIYDSSRPEFSGRLLKRIKTTLTYVSMTDGDTIVRVMAREVVENLSELEEGG